MGLSKVLSIFGNRNDPNIELPSIGPTPKRTPSVLDAYRIRRNKAKKVVRASRRANRAKH